MNGHCEKHGTPYRLEEVRDYPGKTVQVCDACRDESIATGPLASLVRCKDGQRFLAGADGFNDHVIKTGAREEREAIVRCW